MSRRNVLLVDDSQVITNHLRLMLSELPGVDEIAVAPTIPQAQAAVKKGKVDIVILDIQLPDGNGIDFLKWIKFLYPHITVIMFSNLVDEVHRAAASNAGAGYFFDKSYDFEEVHRTLSELTLA